MDLKILENSLGKYPNRFELTMMAVIRARELAAGDKPLIEAGKDEKPAIVALRELAGGLLVPATMEEMERIREEARIKRENARMEAMEKAEAEGEKGTDGLNAASPDGSLAT